MFDFDKDIHRAGTGCMKWDEEPGLLPMWVADMDFETAPCVKEALRQRVEHGAFGYYHLTPQYYNAITSWWHRRYHWDIDQHWIIPTIGVVPAISAIIQAVTKPGDNVVIMEPVYNCFFSSIRNAGCKAVSADLVATRDADGMMTYSIDWEAFEQACADDKSTVFLLCSPHNPAGRVWNGEELRRMAQICHKHNVFVISDEIHCDITQPGITYTPFATVIDESLCDLSYAVCVAPSKTFNIAGLQHACIIVPDDAWRRRIDKQININETCDVGPLGITALIAAYNDGEPWLEELREYIWANYDYLVTTLASSPYLVYKLEGTYLAWVDISASGLSGKRFSYALKDTQKVWFAAGESYGVAGRNFIRINLACPRSQLQEALRRLLAFSK